MSEIINACYGKVKIRGSDYYFFNHWLGKDYMKDKEIHHNWCGGGYCYIISHKEHNDIHNHNSDRYPR